MATRRKGKENLIARPRNSARNSKNTSALVRRRMTQRCRLFFGEIGAQHLVLILTLTIVPPYYQEADAVIDMEQRALYSASMDYVLMLHKIQEKKKFEFVETLLRFMYAWLTFYYQVHSPLLPPWSHQLSQLLPESSFTLLPQ